MYGRSNRLRVSLVCSVVAALVVSGVGSLTVLPGTSLARQTHRPPARHHHRASTRVPSPYRGHRARGHTRVGAVAPANFPGDTDLTDPAPVKGGDRFISGKIRTTDGIGLGEGWFHSTGSWSAEYVPPASVAVNSAGGF